jgi:hypothetical protein
MMKVKKWNPGKRGEFNPWGLSHRDQCLMAVAVVAVVAVGEETVGAADEDVDSDFIHKCKSHLISQILLGLYGVMVALLHDL